MLLRHFFLLILVQLLFIGCYKDRDKPLIGISFETLQTEYWVASADAIKEECEKRGWDYLLAVADGDANRQFEQINNFISRGVDGIVIAPKDSYTILPIVKAANRAEIPISIYNRLPAPNELDYVSIVADNYEISKNTVRQLCDLAKASNKKFKAMILLGDLGDINALERRRGFDDAIKEYAEIIEVVSEVPTEWNQEKCLAGVTNAFQANPDINFIYTCSDFLFPSIISAMKNINKYHPIGHKDHVLLAGFDGDAMAYQLLKDKYLDADGVQDVFYECKLSVDAIEKRLNGESVKQVLVDPGFVIHQKNFDELADKMWGSSF